MFVINMNVFRLFSKQQSDWNANILSEITSANALVLADTFSVKFAFI